MPREEITPWKVDVTRMCGARWSQLRHLVVPWPSDGKRSALVRYCPPVRAGLACGFVFAEVLGVFVGRQRVFVYDTPVEETASLVPPF